MEELKIRAREAVRTARIARIQGWPRSTAVYLERAGEYRRSALYIYGRAS